ncbi:hypothetical protein PGB34_17775 [Xenophilus arseniciresistens]|uniref:Uncharacterized protein n=1 Tax=Xenophilus arseniciresistens TaxID=1283306 RepID=A0AAE3NB11_9BURK|nr:hypothetical protein [Xenophilus arseniciresistens]MDA7418218.1 hypothetical protein [Xenophilus arseniciresistens]
MVDDTNLGKMKKLMKHLIAPFLGHGLDSELAKDYWWGKNKPWDPSIKVPHRLLKLVWIYVASATVQVVFVGVMILLLFEVRNKIKTGELEIFSSMWILASYIFLGIYVIAILIALFEYVKIIKKKN